MPENNKNDEDDMYNQLREEALLVLRQEPGLSILLHRMVLAPLVVSFEDAITSTMTDEHDQNLTPCYMELIGI
jgi:hypothetical protein